MWNQSTGGKEMDSEYDSFLKDMGWGPKKAKTEEGPYVPPMGDPGLRGLGGSQGPKLMITHGKFAPGQALKEARYKTARVAIGIAPNSIVGRAYEAPKSIFGGKLHHFNSGYAKQMGLETDKDREKELRHDEEGRYVPTEWQAELQDKKLEEKRERLMMELEHAKLLAKMQKNKEKKAPCGAMGTPPPPPGMVAAAPKKAPDETRWAGSTMDQLQKECRQKGLQPAGNRAVLLGKLKADRDEKAKMEANARPHGLNVDGNSDPFSPTYLNPPLFSFPHMSPPFPLFRQVLFHRSSPSSPWCQAEAGSRPQHPHTPLSRPRLFLERCVLGAASGRRRSGLVQ